MYKIALVTLLAIGVNSLRLQVHKDVQLTTQLDSSVQESSFNSQQDSLSFEPDHQRWWFWGRHLSSQNELGVTQTERNKENQVNSDSQNIDEESWQRLTFESEDVRE